jgi:hypothetical protein
LLFSLVHSLENDDLGSILNKFLEINVNSHFLFYFYDWNNVFIYTRLIKTLKNKDVTLLTDVNHVFLSRKDEKNCDF